MNLERFFKKGELIPAIVQEKNTKEVLMLAYMNRESLKRTLETGYTGFFSRSMVDQGISVEDVDQELRRRSQKTGNLKQFHKTDKNT